MGLKTILSQTGTMQFRVGQWVPPAPERKLNATVGGAGETHSPTFYRIVPAKFGAVVRRRSQSGDFADSVTAVQNLAANI